MPVILVVLATVYIYYFTDWFKPKVIQIFYTCRTNRAVTKMKSAKSEDSNSASSNKGR